MYTATVNGSLNVSSASYFSEIQQMCKIRDLQVNWFLSLTVGLEYNKIHWSKLWPIYYKQYTIQVPVYVKMLHNLCL